MERERHDKISLFSRVLPAWRMLPDRRARPGRVFACSVLRPKGAACLYAFRAAGSASGRMRQAGVFGDGLREEQRGPDAAPGRDWPDRFLKQEVYAVCRE